MTTRRNNEHARQAVRLTKRVRLLLLGLAPTGGVESALAFGMRRLCDAIEALAEGMQVEKRS